MTDNDNSKSTATNVARAIVVALDWSSTPDARRAAVSFLESVLLLVILFVFNHVHMCMYVRICLIVSLFVSSVVFLNSYLVGLFCAFSFNGFVLCLLFLSLLMKGLNFNG